MRERKKKMKIKSIAIAIIICFTTSSFLPFINIAASSPNGNDIDKFLFVKEDIQQDYLFSAKGECFVLIDIG